ncbi:L-aminoadipate-semialdehyde dehydrogenase-phosphopantetheinyl transferase [Apis cerana]|uniref:L-aminoadipate-semialdehyde dehydrogenase-phosphopantetheinyl transferase n=1 Tax=Apis cerana cerana TaxID=94128 RepID=A0A2A3E4M7_APICC|nr:L-aminoadipate-semialdehyde dehydrogenase-phosphopantetheinyl transferase [Apis cerana]PBC26119.1 L-aminoadipate-semialdehyde dehydrogenase-phosphopantetheinyl transferase [Apis cerana cerana]
MFQSIRWAFNWKEWNPSEKDFTYAISCIQLEEKERLGKFVFRKDVRASLVGRLMMRKFVNEYGHIPYSNIIFVRDANNKPILKNISSSLSFNVSHQGDYTVLAGETKNVKLGIDIMKFEYTGGKQLSEFFRIMNRNFSSSEWKEIKNLSLDESEQINMFCRHWALKESYVKALGIGIVSDLRTFSFETNSRLFENSVTIDTVLYINGIKQDWLFEETLLNSHHCVAIALQENGKVLKSQKKTFDIISNDKLLVNTVPLFPQDFEYTQKYFEKKENSKL